MYKNIIQVTSVIQYCSQHASAHDKMTECKPQNTKRTQSTAIL